ncbi:maltose ABC transporter substrate-binding protein [Clostridium aestuarii]|uniref:Maltodextrin-binding protein n=1 Tax=Clostridium aestuarii TaxID=338193 RepID=A0ABT4D3U8_9CLOT|nr:maltose ABC transporter substrate-binding protein [Clostridium aestuarii]MCY6484870.1 maltose ABC transporter substrate-binding protein [Clostridium aestuarii]
MSKNLKKVVSLACTTILATSLFVGCGSKTNTAGDNKKEGAKTEKKVELAFWEQDNAEGQKAMDKVIAKFTQENPNIKINRSHYETEDLRKNYTNAAMSGKGPEIVFGPNDNLGVFVTAGLIQPIDKFLGEDFMKEFDSKALAAAKYQGAQYMLPDRNGNELLLIYNKKFVSEAPKTWEELEQVGKKIQKDGKAQYVVAFNEVEPFFTVPFLKAFGGEVFDDTNAESPKPTLNTEAIKQWSQFLNRIHEEKVIPKEADYDVALNLFKEGKAPFLINGPWCFGDLDKANIEYGILPIPSINGKDCAAYSAVKGYTVSKEINDEKKEAVKKFIMFMNNKENQLVMVDGHKQLPTNLEAIKDPKITDDPMIAQQKPVLDKCIPMPIIPQMRAIWDAMKPAQQEILAGKIKPEDVPAKMQKKAEEGIKALGF